MKTRAETLLHHVIMPVMYEMETPNAKAAGMLLIGTAAQESHLGTYLKQVNGPALGIFQMEPKTYHDIWNNYLDYRFALARSVKLLASERARVFAVPYEGEMIANLAYATAMARVHYLRVRFPLPAEDDIESQAHYWKRHFNTMEGKGTVAGYIANFKRFVA